MRNGFNFRKVYLCGTGCSLLLIPRVERRESMDDIAGAY